MKDDGSDVTLDKPVRGDASGPAVFLALADRCEREEPSRALGVAIFTAIGLTSEEEAHCAEWCMMDRRTDLTRERYMAAWAPEFTTSLDAAVTLRPAGHTWSASDCARAPFGGWACVRPNEVHGIMHEAMAATPALALCAAALRARAAMVGK